MKTIKMNVNQFEGLAVTVKIKGGIEEYALNFLNIYNNVRESRELLKIENHWGNNDVTVYCEEETKEALVNYLKKFGEIKSIEKVLMYQLEDAVDYDFDKYEDAVVVPYFE